MLRKVEKCRQCGANGIVFGILDENGFIDMERNAQLAEMAGEMENTFHMAFDFARDVDKLEKVISLKCTTILTRGGLVSALNNLDVIRSLV